MTTAHRYGQLGLGDSENRAAPCAIALPTRGGRVVGISAGYAHTVLRDDAGRVFTMGQAANGQLGNGRDDEDAEWPVLAPELN